MSTPAALTNLPIPMPVGITQGHLDNLPPLILKRVLRGELDIIHELHKCGLLAEVGSGRFKKRLRATHRAHD